MFVRENDMEWEKSGRVRFVVLVQGFAIDFAIAVRLLPTEGNGHSGGCRGSVEQ